MNTFNLTNYNSDVFTTFGHETFNDDNRETTSCSMFLRGKMFDIFATSVDNDVVIGITGGFVN